jgi:hypothetical protein
MRKAVLVTLLACLGATPAFAQTGNGAPSGAHNNLNIIGVSKGKTSDMPGSERHTIFVALGDKSSQVTSNFAATIEAVETGRVYELRVTLPEDV